LRAALERAGIRADGVQRLAHLVMQAELDAVVCSGDHRGNQCTYALLDERVPASRTLSRDAALAELTRRYFQSHGPAQLQDFVWWSGLTTRDARRGLEAIQGSLEQEVIDGKTYWFPEPARTSDERTAYLLGPYDEYLIAYKDRSAALDRRRWTRVVRAPFSAPVVVNGQVVGAWRKRIKDSRMTITMTLFAPLNRTDRAAVDAAAHACADFFGLTLEPDVLTEI
jgi:hypothetical protein